MAQLQSAFNAQQFDPTQGGNFSQLPVGKHVVVIVASEVKATSDNTGGLVQYDLQVIEGPGTGKTGPMRLNLYNKSDKARQIAESQQAALCYATGVLQLQDTQQLHGIPFMVEVENQDLTPQQLEKQANGETVTPFTQVRKILNRDGSLPGMQGGSQPQQQGNQGQQQGNWQGQQQQPQQQGNGGWNGGQQQNAPAPAPQEQPQNNGGGWQQNNQQQQPQGNGGWQQNNQGGNNGAPAWGKR